MDVTWSYLFHVQNKLCGVVCVFHRLDLPNWIEYLCCILNYYFYLALQLLFLLIFLYQRPFTLWEDKRLQS